jgi:DNA-binding PadR family transcriptional regulator
MSTAGGVNAARESTQCNRRIHARVLLDRPMTGWDLVATAERVIGDFWSLTRSQVYRELSSMAEEGLVEAGGAGPP